MWRQGCDNSGQGRWQGEELGRRWRTESGGGNVQEKTGQREKQGEKEGERGRGRPEREIEERGEGEPRVRASGGFVAAPLRI